MIGFSFAYIDFGRQYLSVLNKSNSAVFQADLISLVLNKKSIETEKRNEPTTLMFTGDVMLSRGVAQQIEKYNDFNYPFLNIASFLKSADLVLGNLEGPISDGGDNQGSIYSFRDDPRVVQGLKFAGFGTMFLANNHIMDWGRDALNDTVSVLKSNGIDVVGAGADYVQANNVLLKNINNTKIAIMDFTTLYPKSLNAGSDYAGVSDFNIDAIEKEIKLIKDLKIADIVVVSFHWGVEYENHSDLSQEEIGHKLIDSGADLIVGHHPHVIQEIEKYGDGTIVYSLGNFVFDQNFSKETKDGLILKVEIRNKKIENIEPIKIEINDTFQPQIAN